MDRMNSLAQELLRVGLPSVRDYALALLDLGVSEVARNRMS